MKFNGFDWDDGNLNKCQKHGVSIDEIEQLFIDPPFPMVVDDAVHSQTEKRFIAVGQTDEERYIFIGFTLRQKDSLTLIRPITARYMHNREVEQYEKGQE